jgi:hypothetical protein
LVRNFTYENDSFPGSITLDLKNLVPGVYMIELVDNSNTSLVRSVIRH